MTALFFLFGLSALCVGTPRILAQEVLVGGLDGPVKLATTPGGNFLIAESGTGQHDGQIELISRFGHRFSVLRGLPSALTPEGISGPTGIADAHRTLYILVGEGDVLGSAPPPIQVPNPDGLSSPIFSALLRAEFYPVPDEIRTGLELDAGDIRRLADGHTVERSNDSGERVRIELLTDFRDLEPDPFLSVRQANPFDVALSGSLTQADLDELGSTLDLEGAEFQARLEPGSNLGRRLRERSKVYVVDAGMNTLNEVSAATGRSRVLVRLPPVPNPSFPNLGGPVSDAVPTSVHVAGDQLLLSHLAGFPFASGTSTIFTVDAATGNLAPLVTGLTSVTDVFARGAELFVTEVSTDLLSGAPGRLLRIGDPNTAPEVLAPVLIGPTGITLSPSDNALVVAETFTGTLRSIPLP
jgi:hypothetical protein